MLLTCLSSRAPSFPPYTIYSCSFSRSVSVSWPSVLYMRCREIKHWALLLGLVLGGEEKIEYMYLIILRQGVSPKIVKVKVGPILYRTELLLHLLK